MMIFRWAMVRGRQRNKRQKAPAEVGSQKIEPATTTASRRVMESPQPRYRPPVAFLMRIRKRFFTECMLSAAGTERRFDGLRVRTW
jgi:hypothetical protein